MLNIIKDLVDKLPTSTNCVCIFTILHGCILMFFLRCTTLIGFFFQSDFYCLGDVAFPIRWCAPETLMCTESVIEAKDITREANIW